MKRILITGTHGYIGSSFLQYIQKTDTCEAVSISMRDDRWRAIDFSDYDVIVHTVGLAHIKETAKNEALYYKINRDLAIEAAEKAKAAGVWQFIFLSSMSVYGVDEGAIGPDTPLHPKNHYGKSKLQAEKHLKRLQCDSFRVAILRPPMVYGAGCKGNYQMLVKLAKYLPVCPNYRNKRSMISIENLCAFIKNCIDHDAQGIFCPQDAEYVCTCKMIQSIAAEQGKKLHMTKLLNFGPAILKHCSAKGKKAFGDLYYDRVEDP